MGEPSRYSAKGIPSAPADGYVIETGAAAGMRSHLKAEDLQGIRCGVCGGRAGMGTDGRLYITHDDSKHFGLAKGPAAASAMSAPLRRDEDAPGGRWWDQ